ncbi:hypothetical protein TrST_g3920 [Triparma strigata]|uniref:Uncharacterized protein n=1 Tax=Triparma strigata TaxID=1606541 RepID=A0A9W7EA23_9STRA|nr:hypothetical protein TrST_g3920 [Triparma strigata]
MFQDYVSPGSPVPVPKTTTVDTTLAEGQASFFGSRELQNCRQILESLDLYVHDPLNPPMSHIDNSTLVLILQNAKQTRVPYAKIHIALKVAVLNLDIRVEHKRSHQMVSDLGTKTLPTGSNAIHSCTMQNIPQSDFPCFHRHILNLKNRLEKPNKLDKPNYNNLTLASLWVFPRFRPLRNFQIKPLRSPSHGGDVSSI